MSKISLVIKSITKFSHTRHKGIKYSDSYREPPFLAFFFCMLLFLISFLHLCYVAFWVVLSATWVLSVRYGSTVVIRWHITLKCLLLFYKINFCEAHMPVQQQQQNKQQRSRRIITWCQFNLLPLSLTKKTAERNRKMPQLWHVFFYLPSESFQVELRAWSLTCYKLNVCVGFQLKRGIGKYRWMCEKMKWN